MAVSLALVQVLTAAGFLVGQGVVSRRHLERQTQRDKGRQQSLRELFPLLNQDQQDSLSALMMVDPSAAHDQGLKFLKDNQAQQNWLSEQQLAGAQEDRQFAQHQLNVRKQNFAENEAERLQLVESRERELAHASLFNVEAGANLALRDGREAFPHIAADGTQELIPIKGTAPFNAGTEALRFGARGLAQTDRLFELMTNTQLTVESGGDPSRAVIKEIQQLVGLLQADIRERINLGVPTGADLQLQAAILGDPTEFTNRMLSGGNNLAQREQVVGLSGLIASDTANAQRQTRNWDIDNRVRQAATFGLVKTQANMRQHMNDRAIREALTGAESPEEFQRVQEILRLQDLPGRTQQQAERLQQLRDVGRTNAGVSTRSPRGSGVGREATGAALGGLAESVGALAAIRALFSR